jgi:hypothetical protein
MMSLKLARDIFYRGKIAAIGAAYHFLLGFVYHEIL